MFTPKSVGRADLPPGAPGLDSWRGFAVGVPRRRRQSHGLERVLGTPALFATAYGNVGSSIYYALGVTAAIALGLTPLVFVISGADLRLHRGHLRRGDGELPRGGRLVELRPPRVQRARLVRGGLGADAELRHHGRHLGVLRPALPLDLLGAAADEPVGRDRRDRRRRPPRRDQHRRDQGGGGAERRPRRGRLRDAAAARRARVRPRLHPARPLGERALGHGADVVGLRARDPGGDDRLHRDRNRLEPGRGGARPAPEHPGLDPARRGRRLRDLLHAAARRALGAAGAQGRGGPLRHEARPRPAAAASRTTRCSASSRTSTCTAWCSPGRRSTSASWPPRSSSSRRTRA